MINSLHKQLHALQNVQSPVFFARICFFFLQFSVFYFRVAVAAVFVALSTLQAKPARYSFGKKKNEKEKHGVAVGSTVVSILLNALTLGQVIIWLYVLKR